MDSNAKYTLVGVFILSFFAALVAALLWLSEATGERDSKKYLIFIRNHSLSGLQVNSAVTMKGIRIGSVLGYEIPSNDVERVKVQVSVEKSTPVKTDTRAVIKRNLLTGLAWVELKGSTERSPILSEVPEGEKYPIISEGRTDLDVLADSLPGLMEDVSEMVNRIGAIASPENAESVSVTLANLRKVSTTLAENDDHLAKTVKNMDLLSQKLLKVTEPLEALSESADGTIKEVRKRVLDGLEAVKEVATALNAETKKISDSLRSGVDLALVDLSKLTKDLSRAAQSVALTMDELSNPREIITGPSEGQLGPGE